MEEVGKEAPATTATEDRSNKAAEHNNAKLSVLECARRSKSKAEEEMQQKFERQQKAIKQKEVSAWVQASVKFCLLVAKHSYRVVHLVR